MAVISTADTGNYRLRTTRKPCRLLVVRWATGPVGRWSHWRGGQLRCAMVILAVSTLLGVQSGLVWHAMAGQRIRLAQASQSATTTTSQHTTQVSHASPGRQPAAAPPQPGNTPAPTPGTTISAAPPTTVSGSLLAVAIIVAMTGVVLGAIRALVRRARCQPAAEPGTDLDTDADTAPDIDPDVDPDVGPGTESVLDIAVERVNDAMEQPAADPAGPGDPERPGDVDVREATATGDGHLDWGLADSMADAAHGEGREPPAATEEAEEASQAGCGSRRAAVPELVGSAGDPDVTSGCGGPEAAAEASCVHVGGRRQSVASGSVILYDRRLGQRVAFESPARLQWDGHDVACVTEDLSTRGARLCFPDDVASVSPPAMGTSVQVTMMLDGALVVLRARVGWRRCGESAPTLGLQFAGVRRHHEELLQSIVLRGTPV